MWKWAVSIVITAGIFIILPLTITTLIENGEIRAVAAWVLFWAMGGASFLIVSWVVHMLITLEDNTKKLSQAWIVECNRWAYLEPDGKSYHCYTHMHRQDRKEEK
ncbi:MAG TPA: hypothetical protein ENH82_13445 [bacterium]|nr:hypothetical protein [bacterium]